MSVTPASAAQLPVTYTIGWQHPVIRPAWIHMGAGGNVMAHIRRWDTWGSTAKGTGMLLVNDCIPDCAAGTFSSHKLTVTFSAVRMHGKIPYYREMTWFTPGYILTGKTNLLVMYYAQIQGTLPEWDSCFPLTNGGKCYEPGEFCRNSDHSTTGLAGDGKIIRCVDKDHWRWIPS